MGPGGTGDVDVPTLSGDRNLNVYLPTTPAVRTQVLALRPKRATPGLGPMLEIGSFEADVKALPAPIALDGNGESMKLLFLLLHAVLLSDPDRSAPSELHHG